MEISPTFFLCNLFIQQACYHVSSSVQANSEAYLRILTYLARFLITYNCKLNEKNNLWKILLFLQQFYTSFF